MSFKVAILNAYDHRNLGDRAIIEAQIAWMRSKSNELEPTVFSSAWEANRSVFGERASYLPPVSVDTSARGLGHSLSPLISGIRAWTGNGNGEAFQAFRNSDAYALCGGGYLYSSQSRLGSRQLWIHAANSILATKQGKPVIQFPQSWGPFNKRIDEQVCRFLAKRLPVTACRGAESVECLRNWGMGGNAIDIPDIVLAMHRLRPDLVQRKERPNGRLGIAPVDFRFAAHSPEKTRADYVQRIVSLGKRFFELTGEGISVFTQVSIPGADDDYPVALSVSESLIAQGVDCRLIGRVPWAVHWGEIAELAVFAGCRMHSCIFSMVSGVPTLGIAYQPKFHALFGHFGMPELCHDILSFHPEEVAEQAAALANEGASARDRVTAKVEAVTDEILEKLNSCWELSGFPTTR